MTYFCSVQLHAQQVDRQTLINSFPKEQVTLIVNAKVILSGQMLGYSILCNTKNSTGSISDIGYVELISDSKTTIFKHKLRLIDGKAYGDYFLPTTLKTGHYKLIVYTTWTLTNVAEAFDQKDIYIINPYLNAVENNLKNEFSEKESYIEISINPEFSYKNHNQVDGFKITTDLDSYKKRSKVSLKVQNMLHASKYETFTMLVKKIDSIGIQNHNIIKSSRTKTSSSDYLPEMRGELIQGTVVDLKTKLPVADQAVSLSISDDNYIYKSSKTNNRGEFYFNLYESFQQENALIQVVSENRNDVELKIEPKVFDRYDELEFYPIKLNKNLEKYITQNSVFNQVESAYYNLKPDSLIVKSPTKSFYGVPDIVYVLDDFTRFNSVKETFIEVIQEAAIRNSNGGYQFLVYDFNDPFNLVFEKIKPLLLLDGIQIQNETIILDYNPKEIESVSLVKGVYSIGSVIYNGIIDIKLKKPSALNYSGTFIQYLDIQKPVDQKVYFKQNYSIDQKRTPDFRTQLLWQPKVELESNSQHIDFYTSDVPGYYMIELNGISINGETVQLREIFKVENE